MTESPKDYIWLVPSLGLVLYKRTKQNQKPKPPKQLDVTEVWDPSTLKTEAGASGAPDKPGLLR